MGDTSKTISEQFEEIKVDICNNYCKYHENIGKEEDAGKSSDICDNCPLGRL